jgi:pyruvate,water dikinase
MKILVKGWAASPGRVRGKARVIVTSEGVSALKYGEILVARITDPTMFVEIIQNAAGIVTDIGGAGSHPAIVAREMGIPCVVATRKATKVITTGKEILVDGQEGIIYEPD